MAAGRDRIRATTDLESILLLSVSAEACLTSAKAKQQRSHVDEVDSKEHSRSGTYSEPPKDFAAEAPRIQPIDNGKHHKQHVNSVSYALLLVMRIISI